MQIYPKEAISFRFSSALVVVDFVLGPLLQLTVRQCLGWETDFLSGCLTRLLGFLLLEKRELLLLLICKSLAH